jgi:hypothetical protein
VITDKEMKMSKAQELVDYLNARIARTGYNERQAPGNTVYFSLMQGKKYARIVLNQGPGVFGTGSSYAFVDNDGNIYKSAGWKAPAKGVRGTVDEVVSGQGYFAGNSFDLAAYSTSWLYL